ncbi:MAG TPA: hypothetical protein PKE55_06520 [Kiritimatiellia bacterium]|nr:hypothetical protein [Kiritimatiellia bacterium]
MLRRITLILMFAAGAALYSGCAHPDRESELPWNTPQSWEGSPFLPGMDQR